MPSPAIRKNPAPPSSAALPSSLATGASAPNSAPSSPAQTRDSAISDISAARTNTRPRRTPSWTRAADLVARTYEERGGSHGVHELLRSNPDVMRAIATGPAEAIEDRMQEVAGSFDGANALESVQTFVSSAVRDGVATSAQRTIRGAIGQVEAQRTDILSNLERYQNAPAGSRESQTLAALNLSATSTEAEVNRAFDTSVEGLEGLLERFEGLAWEVGDFPTTARATTGRMRLRAHIADTTLADRAVRETSGTAEDVVTRLVDTAHVVGEARHLVHAASGGAGAVLLPAAVLAGGLALGMAIHHGAEEIRNEAIDLAHSLGI
ncbi:MAG: hypothetical protein AB8H86_26180 [Polyangiales bacterium]